MSELWEQLGSFAFSPDFEKKSSTALERRVAPQRGAIVNARFDNLLQSCKEDEEEPLVAGYSSDTLVGTPCSAVDEGLSSGAGLHMKLPPWLPRKNDNEAFAFCATVLFATYYKCGGDEAVLALDACPPTVMLNPFSNPHLQDAPFPETVNDIVFKLSCVGEHDTGRQKIIEALQNQRSTTPTSPGALLGGACITHRQSFERLGAKTFAAAFDVVWVIECTGLSVQLDLVYNSSVYKPESASNWLQIVKTIANTPNLDTTNIRDVSALDCEMHHRLIYDWQPHILDRDDYTKTIAQLFVDSMEQHVPDPSHKIAVFDPVEGYSISYAELDEWSTKVALYLQTEVCAASKHRFGVDAVCALHMPRCGDWYVWMLGILKAGGCYLSLDPDFPADRLSYILEDSSAMCLITKSHMVGTLNYSGGPVIAIDKVQQDIVSRIKIPSHMRSANNTFSFSDSSEASDETPWNTFTNTATPNTPAYMIYTSGSTGKPKGVIVENINCVSFVLSERELFTLGSNHRVIQGFSTSFDASVEEIWLAFASGSTLLVVQKRTMQDAEALQDLIVAHDATVLSTVPTLLATMEPTRLQQLSLVIVGGEACNKEVVEMYATGGHRKFVNSYGPTEATVACCAAFCSPDQPVTIGRAQPNYFAAIIDPETRNLLPPGVPGELCMFGPGVTRGYVNREELTKEKFLSSSLFESRTWATHGKDFCRMYRTGDLVRWTVEGNIEFLGRIDSQVKLRGFRIEVSEIENVLSQHEDVTTAVVILRNDEEMPYLCAYIVGSSDESGMNNSTFRESAFRDFLKTSLPSYMIPSRFVPIQVLPRSPAGKLDRKALPAPAPLQQVDITADDAVEKVKPSTTSELFLMEIWSKHFPGQTLGIDDNFFEIGGHSLLAGKVSSQIRRTGFDGFSIRNLYANPTVRLLAEFIDTTLTKTGEEDGEGNQNGTVMTTTTLPRLEQPSLWKKTIFMLIHVIAMHFVFMVLAAHVFIFLYGYDAWSLTLQDKLGTVGALPIEGIALSLSATCVAFGYTYLVVPLVKWTLIWKFQEGEHSIWGWFYIRWWTVRALSSFVPLHFLAGTSFANLYLRLMGASIGRNVTFMPGEFMDFDLISIGEDSAVGHEAMLAASEVIDSVLVLRAIRIGRACSVGARCLVKGGAVMEDESMLQHLSLLTENARVGSSEVWGGSPAAKVGVAPPLHDLGCFEAANEKETAGGAPSSVRLSAGFEVLLALTFLLYFVVVFTICNTPIVSLFLFAWWFITTLDPVQYYLVIVGVICLTTFISAVILFYIHLVLVAFRWIVLPWDVQPGHYPCNSLMYHRKIFFDFLMRISLTTAHPLYASIYTQFFLRALGCDVGKRVECSNLFGFTPGLIKFGNETFVADFVGVNPPTFYRGVMMLGFAEIEDRAFVGNGSVIPANAKLQERSLVGLLSHPTKDVEVCTTYIGSPAFSIPRQAKNDTFGDQSATYQPPTRLIVARCVWEFFRIVTPTACLSISTVLSFMVVSFLVTDLFALEQFATVIHLFVWVNILIVTAMIFTIKKVVVGTEKPAEHPLWSSGVWRAELVVDCTTTLGTGTFLKLLRGTPMIAPFFRMLGAKIGTNCYIDTIFFTEPDMVTIGDNCCIGDRVTIQTHLFEDRVMKIEPLTMGDRVSVGPLSIVLYNTIIESGVTVGSLSLVMKGEAYPAGTHWEGAPAQRRAAPTVLATASLSIPMVDILPSPCNRDQDVTRPGKVYEREVLEEATQEDISVTVSVDSQTTIAAWLTDDGLM